MPNKPNTNTGHGHVWDRPDGKKFRCGGPGLCYECSRDAAHFEAQPGGEIWALNLLRAECNHYGPSGQCRTTSCVRRDPASPTCPHREAAMQLLRIEAALKTVLNTPNFYFNPATGVTMKAAVRASLEKAPK